MRPAIQPINGIILLNKERGISSNRALQDTKKLIGAKKAGHGGSLDPEATGMLILCFGEATKICPYLLEHHKTYHVVAELGAMTSTGDSEGEIIKRSKINTHSDEYWDKILKGFLGDSSQTPPMYSALKQDGVRLYKLARQGKEVERKQRKICITSIKLEQVTDNSIEFIVTCSKGTYIRVLVEDIIKSIGMVGYTKKLHRIGAGPFIANQMLTSEALENELADKNILESSYFLSADQALSDLNSVSLNTTEKKMFNNGQSIKHISGEEGPIRVYDEERKFLGIGINHQSEFLKPQRIFHL